LPDMNTSAAMIALFSDFGLEGPYIGQIKAVLLLEAPSTPVIDLFADAPVYDPRASAYLLAAYVPAFPQGTIFLCVVDPGVGSGGRRVAVINVDGRWFVGPDNGLFNIVASRGTSVRWWDVSWCPDDLSATFHGRDLFAPLAARLARGQTPPGQLQEVRPRLFADWPQDYWHIVYIDHFGNAMTGIRAGFLPRERSLVVRGHNFGYARTYSDVPPGQGFWYENANGLVEIAINQGRADERWELTPGDVVTSG